MLIHSQQLKNVHDPKEESLSKKWQFQTVLGVVESAVLGEIVRTTEDITTGKSILTLHHKDGFPSSVRKLRSHSSIGGGRGY